LALSSERHRITKRKGEGKQALGQQFAPDPILMNAPLDSKSAMIANFFLLFSSISLGYPFKMMKQKMRNEHQERSEFHHKSLFKIKKIFNKLQE
jgi:hypothetical protein